MPIAVVTDSSACLTDALAQEHGVEVVPLHTHALADGGATTSGPSVEELAQAYRAAARRSPHVLAIHLTAALSGTLDSARLAAQQVGSQGRTQVEVIDSGTCSAALALTALTVSSAHDLKHGAALAHECAARSHQYFIIDSLNHLARSGRIDRATARLGGVLGIRPILEVAPAGIRAVETVRGAARARRHLISHAVHAAGGTALSGPRPPAEPVRLAIQADDPQGLAELAQDLQEALTRVGAIVVETLTLPIDDALRVHLGPGALGIAVAPAAPGHRATGPSRLRTQRG